MGAGSTLTLPLVNTRAEGALSYNFYVNWGDSTSSHVTAYNDANRIHTYTNAGNYTVEIRGTCEGWRFNNAGNKLNLIKIVDWGRAPVFNGFKYLANGFYGCSNLTTIANGPIPASGAGILTNGFFNTFWNCTSITSIPANLFRYHTSVSTNAFNQTFSGCTNLAAIPVDLFRYNTDASTSAFNTTFATCASLTSLPVDLFRYNTNVSGAAFSYTFYQCVNLASIPADLFRYNPGPSSGGFDHTFEGCDSLTVNGSVWFRPGEENTRFLNINSDFTNCFGRFSFSGAQGIAPDVWTCDFGETITLSTAPVTDWAPGDTITGQTSGATALVVSKVSALVYKIKQHFGTFTLGETVGVTGVPLKLCVQDGSHPIFNGTPVSTLCFGLGGNSIASLSNYASIPASWR
jgi:hypothetical protein